MPGRKLLDDLLADGVIGNVTSLTANLGYVLTNVERMIKPELAGGALLDVGVYPINFALMTFHSEVAEIDTTAVMSDKGVDLMNSVTLTRCV